jgi:hypothetical protein
MREFRRNAFHAVSFRPAVPPRISWSAAVSGGLIGAWSLAVLLLLRWIQSHRGTAGRAPE